MELSLRRSPKSPPQRSWKARKARKKHRYRHNHIATSSGSRAKGALSASSVPEKKTRSAARRTGGHFNKSAPCQTQGAHLIKDISYDFHILDVLWRFFIDLRSCRRSFLPLQSELFSCFGELLLAFLSWRNKRGTQAAIHKRMGYFFRLLSQYASSMVIAPVGHT